MEGNRRKKIWRGGGKGALAANNWFRTIPSLRLKGVPRDGIHRGVGGGETDSFHKRFAIRRKC